jgi:hypothetical protein
MPKSLANKFAETGTQIHSDDPIVLAHFFNISGHFHWLAIEYDESTRNFLGYTYEIDSKGYSGKWCHFSLDFLSKLIHPDPEMPIPDVELDTFFPENYHFSQVCRKDAHTWNEYKRQKELDAIEKVSPNREQSR